MDTRDEKSRRPPRKAFSGRFGPSLTCVRINLGVGWTRDIPRPLLDAACVSLGDPADKQIDKDDEREKDDEIAGSACMVAASVRDDTASDMKGDLDEGINHRIKSTAKDEAVLTRGDTLVRDSGKGMAVLAATRHHCHGYYRGSTMVTIIISSRDRGRSQRPKNMNDD